MTNFLIFYTKTGLVTGIVVVVIAFLLKKKNKIQTNKIIESPIFAGLFLALIWPIIWLSLLFVALGIKWSPLEALVVVMEKAEKWTDKKISDSIIKEQK